MPLVNKPELTPPKVPGGVNPQWNNDVGQLIFRGTVPKSI
jgi:hypothetical protein